MVPERVPFFGGAGQSPAPSAHSEVKVMDDVTKGVD
jgi:hypothetical protein